MQNANCSWFYFADELIKPISLNFLGLQKMPETVFLRRLLHLKQCLQLLVK